LTSPKERIKEISNRGNGFLYTVTVKGITGTRNEFDQEVVEFLKKVKEISPIPVVAGFGISNEKQINELSPHCDGVIVGSKIVDLFHKNDLNGLERFMSVLKPEKNII
jgi:tryptophan synthase alpha chain